MNVVWLYAMLYRLINAWMVRTQFDPDEYWQTLEPAYCLVFGVTDDENNGPGDPFLSTTSKGMNYNHGCALTWEWTRRWNPPSSSSASSADRGATSQQMIQPFRIAIVRALHGPVRSYVSILPTYWYYLACRSLFNWAVSDFNHDDDNGDDSTPHLKQFIYQHATYIISKGPVFLHAILISATTDLSVWSIASQMNNLESPSPTAGTTTKHNSSWPFWALVCSITSWFNGYALTRTFANSFETMCLLVGISLLGPVSISLSSSCRRNIIYVQ